MEDGPDAVGDFAVQERCPAAPGTYNPEARADFLPLEIELKQKLAGAQRR